MKQLLIILTFLGSIYATNTFAQSKTPAVVLQSFTSSYDNAKEVTWTEVDNLYKANFNLDGQQNIFAFFDAGGNLVASARNISFLQLPIPLQAGLKKNFKIYFSSELFEVNNEEGTTYYATLENSDFKLQVKSTSYGDWTTYQKSRI